jgi:hypothetical protein
VCSGVRVKDWKSRDQDLTLGLALVYWVHLGVEIYEKKDDVS